MAFAQKSHNELQSPPEADGGPTHSAHPAELIVEPSLSAGQAGAGVWGSDPVNPVILSKKDRVNSQPPNALTMQVIMSQRPASVPEDQWRKMMLDPVNASLYPIRITQAMLDTIDATQLDLRYRYMMVR